MISERFRQLVAQQLDQFCDCQELVGLGVYVAMPAADGELQLQLVQAWPLTETRLEPAAEAAPLLHSPAITPVAAVAAGVRCDWCAAGR